MAFITDPLTKQRKEKGVTELTPPADEIATNPLTSAASYQERVRQKVRATEAAKRRNIPVGHVPPIPEGKLDPIAQAGRQQAMAQPNFGLPTPPPPPQVPEQPSLPRPQLPGVGSSYGFNQEISQGRVDGPITLEEAKQLPNAPSVPQTDVPRSQGVGEGVPPQEPTQPSSTPEAESHESALDKAEEEIVERGRSALDYFDYEALERQRTPLEDPGRRKAIEARLRDMSFEDLITKREITQEVSVIPGKFSIGFRTVRESEYTWTLEFIFREASTSSAAYIEEMRTLCRLVCGLKSINGMPLPDHRENVGQPNESVSEQKFKNKMSILLGFPIQLVADIGIQFNWFNDRVVKLFSVDSLKNG